MRVALDRKRFGPWALVTGASSGIGTEFARQIAASGINVVLVARRESLLDEVGQGLAKGFNVQYRNVVADLSHEGFLDKLAEATNDLDIGLVVSNAGTGNPGEFLKLDRQLHQTTLRVSTLAHLDITHHFGAKLVERRRGGLILAGAMGAENGVPRMANDGAANKKANEIKRGAISTASPGWESSSNRVSKRLDLRKASWLPSLQLARKKSRKAYQL